MLVARAIDAQVVCQIVLNAFDPRIEMYDYSHLTRSDQSILVFRQRSPLWGRLREGRPTDGEKSATIPIASGEISLGERQPRYSNIARPRSGRNRFRRADPPLEPNAEALREAFLPETQGVFDAKRRSKKSLTNAGRGLCGATEKASIDHRRHSAEIRPERRQASGTKQNLRHFDAADASEFHANL